MLDDLVRLQTSLEGGGAPVQTSRGTLGRSFAQLEPRQREDLASQLDTFIARIRAAQTAAAAAGAGQAEAEAAQAAADDALRALQLVVAADTAARVVGGEAAQDAAITALTQIAAVDPAAPDAQQQINTALNMALATAQAEVAKLQEALDEAQRQLGQQQGGDSGAGVIAQLRQQLTAAQEARDAAQASLNARTARWGAPPTVGTTVPRVHTTYHPRRTGVELVFDTSSDTTMDDERTTGAPGSSGRRDARVFNPTGPWSEATEYDVTNRGTAPDDPFDLTPAAVLYNPSGVNRRVFAASNPNMAHFPGRGTVYRGLLRHVLDNDTNDNNNTHPNAWVYSVRDRLIVQGLDKDPCSGGAFDDSTNPQGCAGSLSDASGRSSGATTPVVNTARWNNWDAVPFMTFQYKSSSGFTMGFGGEGVIFGDLERYAAKGRKNCGAGSDEYCDESTTANVEFSFGEPQADPYNQPSTHYWHVQAQSPRLPAEASPDLSVPGDQIEDHDMGLYEMILSANAGSTDGGTERRLAYAAYGLSRFIDHTTTNRRIGRMQVFHYGLDAFADDDGRRPADLTESNKIEGTFRGKTAAWIVTSINKAVPPVSRWANGGARPWLYGVTGLYRARGDIELRACIGPSNCTLGNFVGNSTLDANQVAGFIRNLEYAPPEFRGSRWVQGEEGGLRVGGVGLGGSDARAGIRLTPAAIQADGTYDGDAIPEWYDGFRTGTYEGAFYGPAGRGMEAAGTWQVNMSEGHSDLDAIIGSFGAICEGTCQPEPETTP